MQGLDGRALAGVVCPWHCDREFDVQIARRIARQAAAAQPQLLAAARVCRHREGHRPLQGRDLDARAEHRFPRRDGQRHAQVATIDGIARMGLQFDDEVEIARTGRAGVALAFQPDLAAVAYAARDVDLQSARAIRRRERYRAAAAAHVLFERQRQARLHVLAALGGARLERPATRPASRTGRAATEDCLEELAEALAAAELAAAIAEVGVPVALATLPAGRRTEFSAVAAEAPQLVVLRALVGILQHFVGLADLLEVRLGIRLLADVRVVFARETPVGLLDVLGRRFGRYPEHFVVVDELHDGRKRTSDDDCWPCIMTEIWGRTPRNASGALAAGLDLHFRQTCRERRDASYPVLLPHGPARPGRRRRHPVD